MNIQHHVATIMQPNLSDCWAAATAIAMRRHSDAGTQHVKNLAAAAGVPLDAGTLPDSSVKLLAGAVRLGFHEFPGAREVTLRELAALLIRGPVVAFGFFAIPSLHRSIKHAVTIFALVGDGTDRGTKIKLIDPAATINPFSDDFEHFMAQSDINSLLSY
jgi:hypothetical protein